MGVDFLPARPALEPEAHRPALSSLRGLIERIANYCVRHCRGCVEFPPEVFPHGLIVDALFAKALGDDLVGEAGRRHALDRVAVGLAGLVLVLSAVLFFSGHVLYAGEASFGVRPMAFWITQSVS